MNRPQRDPDDEVVDAEIVDDRDTDAEILEAEAMAEEDPAGVDSTAAYGRDPAGDIHGDPLADQYDDLERELVDTGVSIGSEADEPFVDGTVGRSGLAAERDEYRDAFMRVKADFENFKKRADKNLGDRVERESGQLVTHLLPVLDACDAAVAQGLAQVEPIQKSFLDILEREGLERLDPVGELFDPNLHEAVMHEEGESGEEPTVVASLRIGYAWKGRVIRPAMVKVRG